MPTTFFLVSLEHGKYYAAESVDPVKRLEELREGLGPFWTQVHRPLGIQEMFKGREKGDLDGYVKRCMRMHGIESVRGGSWENARLYDTQRQALHDELDESSCLLS